MRFYGVFAALLLILAVGCGVSVNSSSPPANAPRDYNGSASVGDFMTITLDPVALTLTYTNHSNGDSGVIPYSINLDGTYTLNDPTGNLLAAYEIPNYALLLQAAKTGPNHDTFALVTAVASSHISLATFENQNFNYMQFRTNSGGIEVGSVSLDAQGNVTTSSYSPSGLQQGTPFNSGGFPAANFVEDPSGTFLRQDDGQGSIDYVFGTPNGIFAVDNSNGAILGLAKASSKVFDPNFAGTYKAIFYEKSGATTGPGNIETGTPSLGTATLTITANAQASLTDAQNNVLAQGTITPVADTNYLFGSGGQFTDPCFGLFTLRAVTGNSQQDVFFSFQGRTILFASYTTALPLNAGNSYDYLYGVAIH